MPFFLRDGRPFFTALGKRLASLDVPSPYLEGPFDGLVPRMRALDPHAIVMAQLETHRGCPYSCACCDWGMATMSRLRDADVVRREPLAEGMVDTWCALGLAGVRVEEGPRAVAGNPLE